MVDHTTRCNRAETWGAIYQNLVQHSAIGKSETRKKDRQSKINESYLSTNPLQFKKNYLIPKKLFFNQ